ncbi:tryptophan halogenase family protein [Brevundimonas sp.]|uniref:tryptophan halogenase family protein n=1 Tax=Brevundimonas sp. TaxID=1871086 RepID=UPI003A905B3A
MSADRSSDRRIREVVIVGGGTAGWMTAAALARLVKHPDMTVRLIESAAIGTVGVGESTLPHIRAFNERLGLDEAEFMKATRATFKLGIQFNDWARLGDSYIHPFGDYGAPGGDAPFHHYWLKASRDHDVGQIDDYSVPVVAARHGRFAPPADDPRSLASTYRYAYQLDAGLYAKVLRGVAEAGGVERVEGHIVEVTHHPDHGLIQSVTMDCGDVISGDLFIDCSGFRGLLIEQSLQTGYHDWSHWLPCDRAVAIPCASVEATVPYTRATALESGWQFRIPLQHRIGNGYVYCSAFLDPDAATQQLLGRLEGAPLKDPNHLRFQAGQRARTWVGNCVAIGLSAGFLEPLESTTIYLIQAAITKLIELWPDRDLDRIVIDDFNRQMDLETERVRDFIILHYHATERTDSELWNHVRAMTLPDSLAAKVELFSARGVVQEYREGLFLHPSWVAVYLGQRVIPARYHPLVDNRDDAQLLAGLKRLRQAVGATVDRLPTQDEYIARYCDYRTSGASA